MRIVSIGSCFPITPVDATKYSSLLPPRIEAAFSAIALVFLRPSSPVHAFAFPLFTTIPCFSISFIEISYWTGAAFTLLVVYVDADVHSASEYTNAISFLTFLSPA